ncbi:MAG: hypothetical protein QW753_07795, partial [Thermofilum sp.]
DAQWRTGWSWAESLLYEFEQRDSTRGRDGEHVRACGLVGIKLEDPLTPFEGMRGVAGNPCLRLILSAAVPPGLRELSGGCAGRAVGGFR